MGFQLKQFFFGFKCIFHVTSQLSAFCPALYRKKNCKREGKKTLFYADTTDVTVCHITKINRYRCQHSVVARITWEWTTINSNRKNKRQLVTYVIQQNSNLYLVGCLVFRNVIYDSEIWHFLEEEKGAWPLSPCWLGCFTILVVVVVLGLTKIHTSYWLPHTISSVCSLFWWKRSNKSQKKKIIIQTSFVAKSRRRSLSFSPFN